MIAPAPRHALLVTHYFPAHGGGVEIVAGQIAERLGRSGATIDWFASGTDAAPSLAGVTSLPQPTLNVTERRLGVPFPIWSPAALLRLARGVRRASVVHVHDAVYLANFVAALVAIALRRRLVVTQHVGFVPYRSASLRGMLGLANRIAARCVLRRADAVIFVSPVVRRYFEALAGSSDRYLDIANGVDSALFTATDGAGRDATRNELGWPAARPTLLFVGRFVEKKGLDLIHAFAKRSPDWDWRLVGHGPIDPGAWKLANVHVEGRIAQAELAKLYRAADALVLPSVGEGFPLVVQEALSAGLPVAVHTETRDAGELPVEVCAAEDVRRADAVDRWMTTLQRLVNVDEDARVSRSRSCREFAASRWSWDATSARYWRLLFDDAS